MYVLPQCIAGGYEKGAPIYALIVLIPMMIFGGGLEEAGWRYILQPELEEKCHYIVATIIVAVIWWLWHFPLFHINGVGQQGHSYIASGAIYKIDDGIKPKAVMAGIMIVITLLIVYVNNRKKIFK